MKDDNKKRIPIFILGILVGILIYFLVLNFLFPVSIVSLFSPENGDQVISFIDSAKQSIDIEMYVFTSREILQAIKRAVDRGVKIRIILEKRVSSNDNDKIFNDLKLYGIETKWASYEYALTHAKFAIVDNQKVFVGSHNFSQHAMYKNREASVIIQSINVVNEFKKAFEGDWIKGV